MKSLAKDPTLRRIFVSLAAVLAVGATGLAEPLSVEKVENPKEAASIDYKKITDAQWKSRLTAEQYYIAREHGTERAYSGKFHDSKEDGIYCCICCKQELFDANAKFDSQTGWPSFYRPIKDQAIGTTEDRKLTYVRTEVHCSQCDAHLGHVFKDAPKTPTGLRYCMNSVVLELKKRDESEIAVVPVETAP